MLNQLEETAVAPVERVEKSLFQFLEERGIKWAKLNYKKGRFSYNSKPQVKPTIGQMVRPCRNSFRTYKHGN